MIPCFPYARDHGSLPESEKPALQVDTLKVPVKQTISKSSLSDGDSIPGSRVSVLRGESNQSLESRRRLSSISTSQPNVAITTLQPQLPSKDTPSSMYKHWTARSGTLIANMLMATWMQ